jgi:hypothetical protein
MNLREQLRQELLEAYKFRHVKDASCIVCGTSRVEFAMHLVEFSQSESQPIPKGFIPMSSSYGSIRGSLPICGDCAPKCSKCELPIVTRWLVKKVKELRKTHTGIRPGCGQCEHLYWWKLFFYKPPKKTPARSPAPPIELQAAIENLLQQDLDAMSRGERPEARLIPHIAVKRDIMIRAYQADLSAEIEAARQVIPSTSQLDQEIKRMSGEVGEIIYKLKREPSPVINSLFEQMRKVRTDLKAIEKVVRAEHPGYSIVDEL